jgi:cellobiose epimerase
VDPREYVPVIRRALEENIAGFWYPRCLDREHGGYVIEFGRTGEVDGPVEKMIVTQARMVWLSARLARFRVSSAKNARGGGAWIPFPARAHVGLQARRVLLAVGPGGNKLRGDKHMYGQSFGVYALSEYAIASKLSEVRQFTLEVFDLLESKAHDGTYGGYRESFDENWRELDSSESGPMGPGRLKLMNTHLHLLEALTTFYRTTDLPRARERLMDLITIQSSSVVRKTLGGCTDNPTFAAAAHFRTNAGGSR